MPASSTIKEAKASESATVPQMTKSASVGSAPSLLTGSTSDGQQGSHWAMASEIAHRLAAERAQAGIPCRNDPNRFYHGKAPGEHGDRNTGPLTLPGWGRPEGLDMRKRTRDEGLNPDTMKRSRSSSSLASTTSAATTMCHSSSSSSIESGDRPCSGEGCQGSGGSSGGDSGSDHDPNDEVTVARGTSAAAAMGARLRAAANLGVCSIVRKNDETRDLCVDMSPSTLRSMRENWFATSVEDRSAAAVARANAAIVTSLGICTDSESDYDDDADDDEYSDEEDIDESRHRVDSS